MKKRFFLLLAVCLTVICCGAQNSAEIQRTFFGIPFGTPRTDCRQLMNNQGMIVDEEDGDFYVWEVKFGGIDWQYVSFDFNQNNRLSRVWFCKKENKKEFETLSNKLNKKYADFKDKDMESLMIKEKSYKKGLAFFDQTTQLSFIIQKSKGGTDMYLVYTDWKSFNKEAGEAEDEL